jgi:hypothetical protein
MGYGGGEMLLLTCVIRVCVRGNAAARRRLNKDEFRVRTWWYDGGAMLLKSGICVGGDVVEGLCCPDSDDLRI